MKPRITAAAGLALAIAAAFGILLTFGSPGGQAQVSHTCSATDRHFIDAAQLNMAALGSISEDYLQGQVKAPEVILQAETGLQSFRNTNPTDPSLAKTRAILKAMFSEYAQAIKADAHHHNAGQYIYRAYGLANFAHDVLAQARLPLLKRGCDVGPLL